MNLKEEIRRNLCVNKISVSQLDPNGLCNSKCWYCPVKYKGNPKEFINQMPIEDVEHIFKNIRNSSLLSHNFTDVLVNNFNEIFLYKDFSKLIKLFDKYKFTTLILTNGTTLNDEHIRIILNNKDIIRELWIHIPVFNKELWKQQTSLSENLFDIMCKNLNNLHGQIKTTIHLSGINDKNITKDFQKKYYNSMLLSQDDWLENKKMLCFKYPKFKIIMDGLIDRAGMLVDHSAYKDEKVIILKENEEVFGCSFLYDNVSRVYNWLCVNAVGDVFLCCNDYDMKHIFGNLLRQTLDECWLSNKHVNTIINSFNSTCKKCVFRQIRKKYRGTRLL